MLSTKELAICFVALHPRARARSMQIGTSAAAFRNTGCLCPSKYLRLKRLSLLENRRYGSLRCTGQPFQWRAGCPPLWLPTLKSCWGASHWMKRFHGDNCLDGFGPHTGNLTQHIRFFITFKMLIVQWQCPLCFTAMKEEVLDPKPSW